MSDLSKALVSMFLPTKTLLSIFGVYPSEDGKYNTLNIVIVILLLAYGNYITTYSMFCELPNIPEAILRGSGLCAALGAIVKFINYVRNRKLIYRLLKLVEHDFCDLNNINFEEEKEILYDYAILIKKFNFFQIFFLVAAGATNFVRTFFFIMDSSRSAGRLLPYKHWMPFNIDLYVDPVYQIVFTLQGFGTLFVISFLANFDCLLVLLIFSTCAQYRILQFRIINFDKNINDKSVKTSEQFLKKCVKLHQKLNNLCGDLETCLQYAMLINFLTSCPYICSCGFILTNFSGKFYIIFDTVVGFFAVILELFLYCYPADHLTEQASKVAEAAYNCNWINSSTKIKKMILLIIMRSQKPIYLTAGKFIPVSVSTFEMVTRSAISYFTVLNSISEEP